MFTARQWSLTPIQGENQDFVISYLTKKKERKFRWSASPVLIREFSAMEFEIDCIYLFCTGFETVSVVLIDTEMAQLFTSYTVGFLCLPSCTLMHHSFLRNMP